MGILTKLFSKTELETIEVLNNKFQNLVKKTKSSFISLVGVSGKIKGLEVISQINKDAIFSKKDVLRFNAKLVEYFLRTKSLPLFEPGEDEEESYKFLELKYTTYYFSENHQFYIIPIEFNENLIVTAHTTNIEKILKEIITIQTLLSKLKDERKA